MRCSLRILAPAVGLLLGMTASASSQQAAMTREAQLAITPAGALEALVEGNARYLAGKSRQRDYAAQRAVTATGQYPFASVVACLDSRVAPEIVFDQGIGDLFVARIAGNFVDEEILGSLEFASKVAGSKLILVLGHTECGAIKGACDGVELGNLTATLAQLQAAVDGVTGDHSPRDSTNASFVSAVVEKNVELTVAEIRSASPILREMEEAGELKIVGGVYDLASGRVAWLQ